MQIKVKVHNGSQTAELTALRGKKLPDLLRENSLPAMFPCGGHGTCGKCRIQILSGQARITNADRMHLSKEELEAGIRLACTCMLQEDTEILLMADTVQKNELDDAMDILTQEKAQDGKADPEARYGIGIDIGTTTIAAALLKENDTVPLAVKASVNHQKMYGADVISRIQAAEEHGEMLQFLVQKDLLVLIEELLAETNCRPDQIKDIAIAGNTTMLHLLRGYCCSGLGTYPYNAVSLKAETMEAETLFGRRMDAPAEDGSALSLEEQDFLQSIRRVRVTLFPGFTAFVGADILSGLYALEPYFEKNGGKFLFLDLGTNGEMAAGDGEKRYLASVAAGPVFEGGGISCGMASVPGAVAHVKITGARQAVCRTIADADPIGLCGTGVMELASALVRAGIADETGLLSEEYFEEGYPFCRTADGRELSFTQADLRQVQLAKAAIAVGIRFLSEKVFGGQRDALPVLFVSGGFGSRIDFESIRELALFPEELSGLEGKIQAAGNTSLQGTLRFLTESTKSYEAALARLEALRESTEEIPLATADSFGDAYYAAMNFVK